MYEKNGAANIRFLKDNTLEWKNLFHKKPLNFEIQAGF